MTGSGNQQTEIDRNDREQIDDPVETENIMERPACRHDAQNVLDRKKQRKTPLDAIEIEPIPGMQFVHAALHHTAHAKQNADDQQDTEPPAGVSAS